MRKERVLHARIPADLDDELRRSSARLGLSVSTVVRNILLHTFDLVEGIVVDGADVARALRGAPPGPASETPREVTSRRRSRGGGDESEGSRARAAADESAVLGWQELTLNVNAVCERCNAALPRSSRAAVGIPVTPRPSFLCLSCAGKTEPAPTRTRPAGGSGRSKPRGGKR